MKPRPTIGQIVHYTNLGDRDGKYPPEIQAAIITKVQDDEHVSLHIFYETGDFYMQAVERAPDDVDAGSEAARGKWQHRKMTVLAVDDIDISFTAGEKDS